MGLASGRNWPHEGGLGRYTNINDPIMLVGAS